MKSDKIPGGNELLNAQDILENQLKLEYGDKVGDLGAGGGGYFTFQAAQIAGEAGLVYAVDVLKLVLKNIEHRAKMFGFTNIKTVWSNLEKYGATNINDSSLERALLINILFQNEHPERILREAVRLLKKGGRLLVIEWKLGRFPFGPPADRRLIQENVEDLALAAGLKKIKGFKAGKFHYGLIFEKI